MATLGTKFPTLQDWASSLDPNGKVAKIVELMNQSNPILDDMVWVEGNLPTGHQTTVRTGLPTSIWRKLYQGVPASKSTRAKITDACGMLETRCEVDVDLANLNGNTAAFRLQEAQAFMESLNQTMASTLFYGNSDTAPEQIMGLANRYSSLSAGNAQNILSAGGSGSDNTSIWLVVWGENTVHGIFPKGSQAGIEHKDLGEGDAFDSSNNRYRAFMDLWQWKCGLTLKDWRYVVRIPNIDISNLVGESSAADLVKLMIRAMYRVPSLTMGRPVWYMNRTVAARLDIQSLGKSSGVTNPTIFFNSQTDAQGRTIQTFRGIPIKVCDALLETEATVS